MIPVTLSLRNFMCYRDTGQVLDLSSVHLACLSGENGAGKSAILEAITWSLWGRARDRAIDDELISKGATEMEVDYHFILRDEHYRVIRKRLRKANSGTTVLELQMRADEYGDSWRILSGATIRETQARINDLLKIDYETFINSAFILQGRADEFTVKNPADRKKVLADILGLDQYDRLEEQAKEEARRRKSQTQDLEYAIARIDDELKFRPSYVEELARVDAELVEVQNALSLVKTEVMNARSRLAQLLHSKERLNELKERIARRESSMVATKARSLQNAERKRELEQLLSRRREIEKGYREWQVAQADERRFSSMVALLRGLESQQNTVEREIDRTRIKLEGNQEQFEKEIKALQRELAGRSTAENNLAEVLDKLHNLDMLQARHEDTTCQRENLDVRMRTLTAEKDNLEKEGKQIGQKLAMLMEAHAASKGHVDCPLCGTALAAEALERVRLAYEQDIAEKRRLYEDKREDLNAANKQIVAIEKQLAREQEELKPIKSYREREAHYKNVLQTLDKAEESVSEKEAALADIRARLAENDYALEARLQLKGVLAEIKKLDYDQEAHERAGRKVAELRAKEYDKSYHALAGAVSGLADIERSLKADTETLETMLAEQEADHTEVAALRPLVDELPSVADELEKRSADEAEFDARVETLHLSRGELRSKIARCDMLKEKKAGLMAEYQAAVDEKSIYDDLAAAFSKKGIQAMIIDNIIPEVENETNTLLHRMTDGRMSVEMATQRDGKTTRSVIETLDINISDEMGTRAYELYSGGEAFRVNFAMRIALSKLLARRAGAQLQTLVIDEGFGSQDGYGREKLVGAIRSIQDDFEKILVITHIEELKDEFPVRINIIKTANGSRIIMGEEEE